MKSFIWLGLALALLAGHAGAAPQNAPPSVPLVSTGACAGNTACPGVPNDSTHWFYGFDPTVNASVQSLLTALNAGITVNIGGLNGISTSANQLTANTTLGNIYALMPAKNGDGGALSHVTNFPSTYPVTGTFWQATQPVSVVSLPNPTGAPTATVQSQQLTAEQASATALAGTLNANLSSATPATASASGSITIQDTASTTTAGAFSVSYYTGAPTAGSFVSQALSGIALARVQVAGTFTGTVQIESSQDSGTTWRVSGGHVNGAVYSSATLTAPGSIILGIGGATNIRVRAIAAMTGTVNVAMTFSNAQTAVEVVNPVGIKDNVSGNQLVIGSGGTIGVISAGSTGLDFSANKPALPNIGANFAASGPYASYVLIATVPANPTRANVDVENISGAQIAIIRDDGTAANAAAPVNASVFSIDPGSSAGHQGGSWTSATFKGRLQIYALSSAAQVTVMVE